MADENRRNGDTRGWLGAILRDVHFWVPLAVLVGGLLVLRWLG